MQPSWRSGLEIRERGGGHRQGVKCRSSVVCCLSGWRRCRWVSAGSMSPRHHDVLGNPPVPAVPGMALWLQPELSVSGGGGWGVINPGLGLPLNRDGCVKRGQCAGGARSGRAQDGHQLVVCSHGCFRGRGVVCGAASQWLCGSAPVYACVSCRDEGR